MFAETASCNLGAATTLPPGGVPVEGICEAVPAQVVARALGEGGLREAHERASCRWFGEREGRFVALSYDAQDPAGRLGSPRELPGAGLLDDLGEGAVALDAASECGYSQVGGGPLYVHQGDRLLYVSVPDGGGVASKVRNARVLATAALVADAGR